MYINRKNSYSAKKIFSLFISFVLFSCIILNMAPSVLASPTLDGIKDEGQYTETNKFVAVKPASTPELTNGQQANIYYTWDDNYVYLYAQYSQNTALIAGKQQMSLWINSSPSKDATKKNSSGNVTTLMGGNNGTCLSNSTTDFNIQVYTTGTSAVFATNEKKATVAGTYVSSKSADNKSMMLEVRVPRESGETEFSFGFEATDWSSTFVRYLSTTTVGNGDPSILSTLFKFVLNPPYIRIDGVKDSEKYTEEKKFVALKPTSTPALTNGQKADIYYAWDNSYVYYYAQYSQNTAIATNQQISLWIDSSPSKDSTKVSTISQSVLSDTNTDIGIIVTSSGTAVLSASNTKKANAAGNYQTLKSPDNKSLVVEIRIPRESGETEFSFGFETTEWTSDFVRYLSTTTINDGNPVWFDKLCKVNFTTNLRIADNYISGFINSETLAGIKSKYVGLGITVNLFNSNNQEITDNMQKISTGMNIKFYKNSTLMNSCPIVIYGDVSGDGAINVDDLAALKSHLLKSTLLSGAYEKAGDLSKKGKITISDLIAVKKQILGM